MATKSSIEIRVILTEVLNCFQQMAQWSRSCNFDNVSANKSGAEALLELVEVHDCGSVGGFGKGQRGSYVSPMKYGVKYHSLYARWLFLAEKYGYDESEIVRQWRKEIEKLFERRRY